MLASGSARRVTAAAEFVRLYREAHGEHRSLHDIHNDLEDEVSRVRAEAVEAVEFWGQFASKYSQAHHGLQSDIESLRGKPNAPGGVATR